MANLIKNVVVALKGFAMGAANVIPGVSGGTIALLTGVFTELVDSLNALLSAAAWKLFFKGRFKEFWEYVHGTFLLWLMAGVIISVFSLAKLMEYVLRVYPIQTWAFFFGLIVVSSIYLLCGIKGLKIKDFLFLLAGAGLGVLICTLSPTQTTDDIWFIAVCGAIAICTMILPGISGSFILVILGKYDYIMSALSHFNIPVLVVFAVGCVLGILAFSKFLHWLLARFERPTLLVLIGFTLGSLVKVWPWNDQAAVAVSGPHIPSALIWMAVGVVVVIGLESLGHRKKTE